MRLDSDELDECCEEMHGHTNWAYADTVSKEILADQLKKGNVVIFFDEEPNEDGEYENYFPISEEDK
jgi:hypothetical protein